MNVYQRGVLALKLKYIDEEIGRRNKQASIPVKGQRGFQSISSTLEAFSVGQNIDPHKLGHHGVNKVAGKRAGLSHETIRKIEFIENKATPKDKQALNAGVKSVNEVYRTIQKEDKKQELLNSKPVTGVTEKPTVIYETSRQDSPPSTNLMQ